MAEPKPFQRATIDAACRSFAQKRSSRRFLVADEVGLGKTVVARDIIRRLAQNRRSPLVVYYITSGQRVAHQNRTRLVDFLEPKAQAGAISKADRLGLIPLYDQPRGKVALYALTPGTSFPLKQKRLHGGRKEERAFLRGLLARAVPHLFRRLDEDKLKGMARSNWDELVQHYGRRARVMPKRFVRAFRTALLREFPGDSRTSIPDAAKTLKPGQFVGRLRRAVAHAVLASRPPDLVIFDEFQRYRDVLGRESRKDSLMASLLEGSGDAKPAVLLLSATPYKLYASRWEESQGVEAHRELFDLLEFLGGSSGTRLREDASKAFAEFGNALRAIVAAEAVDKHDQVAPLVANAETVRDCLNGLLAPYVSRTEREPFSDEAARTHPLDCTLDGPDLRTFRHLADAFSEDHKAYAVPFWLSVPLPAQALGQRYEASKKAKFPRDGTVPKLTLPARNRLSLPADWGHPKLRRLREIVRKDALALPWVAPSRPWWPLGKNWDPAIQDPKLLLFSRFKATPQSVAALVSLEVESRYVGRSAGYEKAWKARKLQPAAGRLPTFALFHPSPLLIKFTDPLAPDAGRSQAPKNCIQKQLTRTLNDIGVRVARRTAKERKRRRPVWMLLSQLEQHTKWAARTEDAWYQVAGDDQRLRRLVRQWHKRQKQSIDWISPRELKDLTEVALSYPGIVVGRALLRHFEQCLEPDHYWKLVRVAWQGVRSYLDKPVFWGRLGRGSPADVLKRACFEGNLEAVLDEHFWIRRQSLANGAAGLAEDLRTALGVTTGGFSFHSLGAKGRPLIHVRCHAAVPFGATDDEAKVASKNESERPPRSDDIRTAFNSPFWPHILATTSVGQEGLDFHTWCRRIVHWDLCPGPLELEQREGRIQRFGGLVIRRKLADLVGSRAASTVQDGHASLWNHIAEQAEQEHSTRTGLSPWWVLKGAAVDRYVFALPHGRDIERFRTLKEQRLIYRLALGQPNQEDLLDRLLQGSEEIRAVLSKLALDLSAFSRDQSRTQEA